MTLGQRIYTLRTGRGMSQEDLADALGVSRQSVSKWETDGSVPDLDKLVRLCEVFKVSLDALVRGKEAEPEAAGHTGTPQPEGSAERTGTRPPESEAGSDGTQPAGCGTFSVNRQSAESDGPGGAAQPARSGMEPRITAAIVLLCMAFLVVLVCTPFFGALTGLIFCTIFLFPGLTCLIFRRHTGLWCAWSVLLAVYTYLRLATGITWSVVFMTPWFTREMNYLRLVIAWTEFLWLALMIVLTARSLGKIPGKPTRQALVWLIVCWAIYVVLRIPFRLPELPRWSYGLVFTLYALLEWARVAALTAALVRTVRYVRGRRRQRAQ